MNVPKTSTWVVVAESSRARLFAWHGDALAEFEDLAHPQSRLHEQELDSDRSGRSFTHGGIGHALANEVDHKEVEQQRFAQQIVQRLEAGRVRGDFARLVLVAPPHFLGLLRGTLNENLAIMVGHSVAKNLVKAPVAEIATHLQHN